MALTNPRPQTEAEKDADTSLTLAIEVLEKLEVDRFLVSVELDIEKPETVSGFDHFRKCLLMAYKKGLNDGIH